MFYVKNIPVWERVIRVIAGVAMLSCSIVMFGNGLLLAYLFIAAGIVTILTGFIGFCPMCALAGRRLKNVD